MKSLPWRMPLLLPVLLCVLAGCSGKRDGGSDAVSSDDLKYVAIAMVDYSLFTNKGPTKPEDLAPYLQNDEKLLGKIRSGAIVVIWGVLSADLVRKDKKRGRLPIVAYEKDVPTKAAALPSPTGPSRKSPPTSSRIYNSPVPVSSEPARCPRKQPRRAFGCLPVANYPAEPEHPRGMARTPARVTQVTAEIVTCGVSQCVPGRVGTLARTHRIPAR